MKKVFFVLISLISISSCLISHLFCAISSAQNSTSQTDLSLFENTQNQCDVNSLDYSKTQTVTDVDYTEKNAYRIIRCSDADGKIQLTYSFPVNSEKLEELGFSPTEIKTFRFFLTTYVNALAKSLKDEEKQGSSVGGVTYFTDVDALGFTISFDDINAQKEFFGTDQENSSNKNLDTKSSGFFVKKTEILSTFAFSKNSAENFKKICLLSVEAWCKNFEFSETQQTLANQVFDEGVFLYDFATTQNILTSKTMYFDGKFHHNVFVKTFQEIEENRSISFYFSSINKPVWYLFALLVVFVGMTISYFALKKRGKV